MKKCKLLHINDGNSETLHNGGRLFIEEYVTAESVLEEYLNDGWEVRQMTPEFTPAVNQEGNYTFYKSGVCVYMEKDEL